jgi:flagellar biosynthesis/type III secretory pathway chaperone
MNGMRARPNIAAYLSNLAEEQSVLARFVELLRSEQDALVRGDADRIAALAEPKGRCIAALQAHAEERRHILLAGGESPDRDGIRSWTQAQGKSEPRLVQRWREFLTLARVADQVNRANGALIAARLRVTQQALTTMFGAAGIPGAYGADGSAVSLREGRQLAVA